MHIALIGKGAIAQYVTQGLRARGIEVVAVVTRPDQQAQAPAGTLWVSAIADLPPQIDLVVDCAGHAALQSFGADILRAGMDLVTVSIGALANPALMQALESAARKGGARLHLASGAIGGLDSLRAAAVGSLHAVTYVVALS